ncbi:type III pantothenate kinase [Candidatus Jidaibacter acanthamoebae]|nr:type III pantothenate kinase [Candidatus Jidaibacter acanthamoeba]
MILCIDVGNTQIHCGVYSNEQLIAEARHATNDGITSDAYGIFLKAILYEQNINLKYIKQIIISSVVPELDYQITNACIRYLALTPIFLNVENYKKIKNCKLPESLGADRVANFISATTLFPNKNLVIVDLGTATTVCVISKNHELLSGSIMPGLKTSAKALNSTTAKLPLIKIEKIDIGIVETTVDSIQIGLFYGHLGAIKELTARFKSKFFANEQSSVIATGGFSDIYKEEKIFEYIIPDLVLRGLYIYSQLIIS